MSNAKAYADAMNGAANLCPDVYKIERRGEFATTVEFQAWVGSDGALNVVEGELDIDKVPEFIAWLRKNYE